MTYSSASDQNIEGGNLGEEKRGRKVNEINEILENQLDSDCCRKKIWKQMENDCKECGKGIHEEDQQICLVGNDVVALFPSMKAKNTGIIVRKRVENSPLKFEGFDYRQAARYIIMNRHLIH